MTGEDFSSEEAAELQRLLLEEARFFELPENSGQPSQTAGSADALLYTIMIEQADKRRTAHLSDPV